MTRWAAPGHRKGATERHDAVYELLVSRGVSLQEKEIYAILWRRMTLREVQSAIVCLKGHGRIASDRSTSPVSYRAVLEEVDKGAEL